LSCPYKNGSVVFRPYDFVLIQLMVRHGSVGDLQVVARYDVR